MAEKPPHEDPNVPHPGMVFFAGQWRSKQGVENELARCRKRGKLRIRMRAGGIQFFLGYTPTVEKAQSLREKIKKEAPGGPVRKP